MGSAAVFFSVVTGLVMIASGAFDLTLPPKVVALMGRLGQRPNFARTLGVLKILGGVGLFIGFIIGPIGILAALGLVIFFILAVRAHAKLGDSGAETVPAAALFILSALTLITNLFS
ncbi:MAG: DoxX family protein [Actinomycetes bacterium]